MFELVIIILEVLGFVFLYKAYKQEQETIQYPTLKLTIYFTSKTSISFDLSEQEFNTFESKLNRKDNKMLKIQQTNININNILYYTSIRIIESTTAHDKDEK